MGIVGAYAGGVYLMTVVGAWLADRVFGADQFIVYSAILILGGYGLLMIGSGLLATAAALFLIATGSGGIKTTPQHWWDSFTKERTLDGMLASRCSTR